jgi:hypothetical protein
MNRSVYFVFVILISGIQALLGCRMQMPAGTTVDQQTDGEAAQECDANTRWVDRIDGSWAILVSDSGDELPFPLGSLPVDLREGEVLRGGRRDLRCGALLKARIRGLLGPLDKGAPRDSPMDVRPEPGTISGPPAFWYRGSVGQEGPNTAPGERDAGPSATTSLSGSLCGDVGPGDGVHRIR